MKTDVFFPIECPSRIVMWHKGSCRNLFLQELVHLAAIFLWEISTLKTHCCCYRGPVQNSRLTRNADVDSKVRQLAGIWIYIHSRTKTIRVCLQRSTINLSQGNFWRRSSSRLLKLTAGRLRLTLQSAESIFGKGYLCVDHVDSQVWGNIRYGQLLFQKLNVDENNEWPSKNGRVVS